MDWNDFLGETVSNLGVLAKEIPDTMAGFDKMGKAAKTNGALDEKNQRADRAWYCYCDTLRQLYWISCKGACALACAA